MDLNLSSAIGVVVMLCLCLLKLIVNYSLAGSSREVRYPWLAIWIGAVATTIIALCVEPIHHPLSVSALSAFFILMTTDKVIVTTRAAHVGDIGPIAPSEDLHAGKVQL